MLSRNRIKYVISISIALAISFPSISCSGGEELDYSKLSLEAALNRMYEVDPEIQINKLACDASLLEIKARKLDTFMPKISVGASIVKPVNIFTKLEQQKEMFFEQQLIIEFAVTSNSFNYILKDVKGHEASMLELKQAVSEKSRKLITLYYAVARAQENYRASCDNIETFEKVLRMVENSSEYMDVEKLEIRNYLAVVTEEKLGALNTLINTRRDLRGLLGLEDREDIDITVEELTDNINKDVSFYENPLIRPVDYTLDIYKKRAEAEDVAARISASPLLRLSSTTILGIAEGRSSKFQKKVITDTALELYITDFGCTGGFNDVSRIKAQIARLELLKAEEDLEYSDLIASGKLAELSGLIDNYKEYITKTEDTLRMFRERLSLPVIEIIRMNDNLNKARYALQQALVDYTVMISNLKGIELKPEQTSPQYQDMSLEYLLARGERNDILTVKQIAEKRMRMENVRINATKAGYFPKITGAAVLENANIDGLPSQATRAYLSLEGRLFNFKNGQAVRAAKAGMEEAKYEGAALQNVVADEIIKNYLFILRSKNTLKWLNRIKEIKDDIIRDMLDDMEGKDPKYSSSDILPLVLQQMELDRRMADVEFSLAVVEYNLKKWTGIPLNEMISVKELPMSGQDGGLSGFMKLVRSKVAPYFDGKAPVKQALSAVEKNRAQEAQAVAYEGAVLQVKCEMKGMEYKGWNNPDRQVSFGVSVPWGNRGEKIAWSEAARARIKSEIDYLKSMDAYEKERLSVKTAYDSSEALLEDLRSKKENMETQYRITEELYRFGGRTKKQMVDSKLDYIVAQMSYDEAVLDNYYHNARELLVVEKDAEPEGKEKILLTGLQEAIDLAMQNSREVRKYEESLDLEKETLDYYRTVKVKGNIGGNSYIIDNKGWNETKRVKTAGISATANIDLVNKYMLKIQRRRVELAEKDLEQAKFDLTLKVADAYSSYLGSLAETSEVNMEYEKQKTVLAGMENLFKAKAIAQADLLKQREFVESLLQKYIDTNRYTEGYRNNLGIAVGGLDPRFSIVNTEVYDRSARRVALTEGFEIKERLLSELTSARQELQGLLQDDLLERAEINLDMARLDTEAISKQVKELAVNLEYLYLTDFMGLVMRDEAAFSRYDNMSEFISLNSIDQIFNPATGTKARIAAISEKVAALRSKEYTKHVVQDALRRFTDYQIAVADYANYEKNEAALENEMAEKMLLEEAAGETSLIRQRELKETVLNNKIRKIQAFYRMMKFMNELDRYLIRYTSKGIESYVTFVTK
ncbi:MAG: TolC family protein [Candidatus Omnitrophica bacterium]|nr:TolC family protein [Candidatus Omnitrophota bacterium]